MMEIFIFVCTFLVGYIVGAIIVAIVCELWWRWEFRTRRKPSARRKNHWERK